MSGTDSTVVEPTVAINSSYRSAKGKNASNWPGFTTDYRKRTRFFGVGNDEARPAVEPTASSPR